MRATPGHLNHFATLLFQQHSQQSALRKGKSRFFLSERFEFHKWRLFLDWTTLPTVSHVGC